MTTPAGGIEALAGSVGRLLAGRDEPHEAVLRSVAKRIGTYFGGSCTLFFFSHVAKRLDAVAAAGVDRAVDTLLAEHIDERAGDDGSRVLPLLRRGQAILLDPGDPEELATWIGRRAQVLAQHSRVTSLVAVPLVTNGRVFGGLAVVRHEPAPGLSEQDLAGLEDLAGRVAGALETERLVHELHRELDVQADVREALHEARERFQAAFAHAPVGLALFSLAPDRLGRIVESNRRMAEMFACEPDDLYDADPAVLSHPDDLDVDVEGMARLLAGETAHHEVEKRFIRFDGETIHVRLVITLVRRVDGTPAYGISLLDDITERRRAEEEVRRLAAVVQSSRDAILAQDCNGIIVSWNAAAERLFGYTAAEAIGREAEFFVPAVDRELEREARARVLAGDDVPEAECYRVAKDGKVVEVAVTASAIRDSDGTVRGQSSIVRDLSERRRMTSELAESRARYQAIVETTNEGVWLIDAEGFTTFVNARMADMLGVPRHAMTGRHLLDFVPPERRPVFEANLLAQPAVGPHHIEREFVRADGSRIWAIVGLTPMYDFQGRYTGVVGLATDITERRRAELGLEQRAAQQEATAALGRKALEGIPIGQLARESAAAVRDGLGVQDAHVVEILPAAGSGIWHASTPGDPPFGRRLDPGTVGRLAERFAEGPGTVAEKDPATLAALCPGSAAALLCAFDASAEPGSFFVLAACSRGPREFRPHEVAFVEAVGYCLASTAKRLRTEEEIRSRALHDGLTGLPNRSLFEERLRHALTRAAQERSMVAVLLVDIDRFSEINEAGGHHAGDDLLIAIGRRLEQGLAPADTVARFGGDEFAVLCEAVDGERGAMAIGQRLLGRLEAPFEVDGRMVTVQASLGIVLDESGRRSSEGLVRDADVALRRAKERGGAHLEVFDEEMRYRVVERLRLEQDLRRALVDEQLRLHFEPVVSVAERRVVALEASLCWEHPALGLVSPAAFLPVAESSGLITGLGRWALREACRQIARWEIDHGPQLPLVSVNVSGHELAEPDFPDVIAATLRRTGVAPERLAIELNDSVVTADAATTPTAVQRLAGVGVQVVLDDFGMGLAPMGYLRHLPLSGLKLDAGLVGGLGVSERDHSIVASVTAMALALGMDVTAKGVERAEQAALLEAAGCERIQGALIARPAPAEAIGPLLDPATPALAHVWRLLEATRPAATAPTAQPRPAVPFPRERPRDTSVGLNDAARALGVSASTLRRWADSGRIEAVRTRGGHRRFPMAEISRLSRETAPVAPEVAIRAADFPGGPVPLLAEVVDVAADRLAVAAGRALYEGDATGWFRSPEGERGIRQWLAAVAAAARSGDYAPAADAARVLVVAAREAGASLLERHLLVERSAELIMSAMRERAAGREELLEARRLFLRLRQLILAETPDALLDGDSGGPPLTYDGGSR